MSRLILAVTCLAAAMPAAATTSISTAAFGLRSTVRAINLVGIDVGPLAHVSGSTSPGYSLNGQLASHSSQTGLGINGLTSTGLALGTGLINTAVAANGTAPADTSSGNASAIVDNFSLGLVTTTLGIPTTIISLSASQLRSQTMVERIGNASNLVGSSQFSNLSLGVAGLNILTLGNNAMVGANHVAYNLAGLSIVMNEQVRTGVLGGVERLITNAMRISFNNYLVGGRTLTGDVIIAQSDGQMLIETAEPIPEPATWLQFIAGFGLIGLVSRRRAAVA